MKKIELTKGKFALVDDEDFESLNQYEWFFQYDQKDISKGYACRAVRQENGKQKIVKMHHVIMGKPKKGLMTDHINENRLDNRRANLRLATNSQNQRNKGKNRNNKSGFKGVYYFKWGKIKRRWKAQITYDGKNHHLGFFNTAEEAHEAYKKAAIKYHGEFAKW